MSSSGGRSPGAQWGAVGELYAGIRHVRVKVQAGPWEGLVGLAVLEVEVEALGEELQPHPEEPGIALLHALDVLLGSCRVVAGVPLVVRCRGRERIEPVDEVEEQPLHPLHHPVVTDDPGSPLPADAELPELPLEGIDRAVDVAGGQLVA